MFKFKVRFVYFPNCVGLVRERWANLAIPYTTDVDGGAWRAGRAPLSVVDAFCRRKGIVLASVVEAQGVYTLVFNDRVEARFAYDEATYNEIQEARWAMS